MAGIVHREPYTFDINSPIDSSNINISANGLYRVANGNGSGGDGGGNDLGGEGDADDNRVGGNNYGRNGRRYEFMFVKASNITVAAFVAINLNTNPHLQFYKSMRRLIYSQGEDGECVLNMPTEIEKTGSITFTNEQLTEEIRQCLEVAQFNRAILAALLSYTTGIARGMVEHGVENGLGAWRRLYYHYVSLADDLRQLLIHEFHALTLVTENNIDTLRKEEERIT